MQPSCILRGANQARRRVIYLVGVLAVGLSYAQTTEAEESTPSSISVHVEQGLLSVDARNAPLGDVLEAIASRANFRLVTKGDLDTSVTWSLADVPVAEGVQRLLGNVSSVMIYAPSEDAGTGPLFAVHTLRRKVDWADDNIRVARTIPTPASNQTTNAKRSQPQPTVSLDDTREVRLRAVRRLIRKPNATSVKDLALLLSQDDDPVIRRIAAIGLGKLLVPEARAALGQRIDNMN